MTKMLLPLISVGFFVVVFAPVSEALTCDDAQTPAASKVLKSVFQLEMTPGLYAAYSFVPAIVNLNCPELIDIGYTSGALRQIDQLAQDPTASNIYKSLISKASDTVLTTSDIESAKSQLRQFKFDVEKSPFPQFFSSIQVKSAAAEALFHSSASCAPISVNANFLPTPSYMPRGWCYAEAASDIISAELKIPISTVGLGLGNNYQSVLDGKIPADQVALNDGADSIANGTEAAKAPFLCSEHDLPNKYIDSGNGKKVHTIEIVRDLMSVSPTIPVNTVKLAFPGFDMSGYEQARKPVPLPTLMKLICHDKIATPIAPNSTSFNYRSNRASTIDAALDSGHPVAVGFLFSFYFYDQQRSRFLNGPNGMGHAATIVGRQFNPSTNQCDYLVRDVFVAEAGNNPWRSDGEHILVSREALQVHLNEAFSY